MNKESYLRLGNLQELIFSMTPINQKIEEFDTVIMYNTGQLYLGIMLPECRVYSLKELEVYNNSENLVPFEFACLSESEMFVKKQDLEFNLATCMIQKEKIINPRQVMLLNLHKKQKGVKEWYLKNLLVT